MKGSAFARKVAESERDIRFSELKQNAFPNLGATIAFKSREGHRYAAHSVLRIHHQMAEEVPNLVQLIDSSDDFRATKKPDGVDVIYHHELSGEELKYLAAHANLVWRSWRAN